MYAYTFCERARTQPVGAPFYFCRYKQAHEWVNRLTGWLGGRQRQWMSNLFFDRKAMKSEFGNSFMEWHGLIITAESIKHRLHQLKCLPGCGLADPTSMNQIFATHLHLGWNLARNTLPSVLNKCKERLFPSDVFHTSSLTVSHRYREKGAPSSKPL